MNEQELPEDGTPVDPVAAHSPADEIESEEQLSDELEENLDDEFEDEELDDEEQEEFEDDEEFVTAKSLLDEIFDKDDLGEVMSELDVLTLEDAAAYLKVEYGQIRRLIKEQGLPGRKIGEEWRFLRGAIADWLSETAEPASAPESNRNEFTQRPPLRERFAQGNDEGEQRYPQQGSRYPQGGNRFQQENRPPRRYNNEGGGYQGGNQGGNRFQGGNQFQGGQYNQGNQYNQGGGNPPPRRPRYGNDQEQQPPQGEYRPPRRGNYDNQGGGGGGQFSGGRKFGGPKKPKRKALNEQRFNRLDRRKFEDGGDQGGSQDAQD